MKTVIMQNNNPYCNIKHMQYCDLWLVDLCALCLWKVQTFSAVTWIQKMLLPLQLFTVSETQKTVNTNTVFLERLLCCKRNQLDTQSVNHFCYWWFHLAILSRINLISWKKINILEMYNSSCNLLEFIYLFILFIVFIMVHLN